MAQIVFTDADFSTDNTINVSYDTAYAMASEPTATLACENIDNLFTAMKTLGITDGEVRRFDRERFKGLYVIHPNYWKDGVIQGWRISLL